MSASADPGEHNTIATSHIAGVMQHQRDLEQHCKTSRERMKKRGLPA